MDTNNPSLHTDAISLKGLGPEDVRQIGTVIGAHLKPGSTVALFGQLGAGKTFMIQSICEGLGVTEPVTSPTFTIVNQYRGRYPVHHVDLYRLKEASELEGIGLEEMVREGGILLFEWPEKASGYLESPRVDIEITWAGPTERDITFSFYGNDDWKEIERAIVMIAGGGA